MYGDLNDIASRLNLIGEDLSDIIDISTYNLNELSGQIFYLSSKNDEISGIILSSSILPEIYYVDEIQSNPPVDETPTGIYCVDCGINTSQIDSGFDFDEFIRQNITVY